MIILEGPDGAGKTTLANTLSKELSLPIAPRVVSKETEAMTDLRVWTDDNLKRDFQDVIFDRHRLISDPIYRGVLGKHNPRLYDPQWLAEALRKFVEIDPVIIFCMPPLEVIMLNLLDDDDNTVVVDHIERLYYGYAAEWAKLNAWTELTSLFWYDYSNPFGETDKTLTKYLRQELS